MRDVLIAAAALVALAGSAEAARRHQWFMLSYADGTCEAETFTPEQFYIGSSAMAAEGTSVDRIAPENVTKDAAGSIHVHMTGRIPAGPRVWDFFTNRDACEKFISDNGIKPEQAPHDDIN
jgi:hypothetical protein